MRQETVIRCEHASNCKKGTCSKKDEGTQDCKQIARTSSMFNLIKWNISKALDKNPSIDLRASLRRAQEKMRGACDSVATGAVISELPEEQHLQCALLAWQQLGHRNAESLCRFYESYKEEKKTDAPECMMKCGSNNTTNSTRSCYCEQSSSFGSQGPVVKLPVETILRYDSPITKRSNTSKPMRKVDSTMKKKIDKACCLDSECAERLGEVDKATAELRKRAKNLALREADRVELLERAATAWKDLERGFQRRLCLAEEKEDELKLQIDKMIGERNTFKNTCLSLTEQLKKKSGDAEKEKEKLNAIEKEVCDRGCIKYRLGQESAHVETALVEQQCKASHFDRDLQFKEEQAQRMLLLLEKDLESTRAISLAAERAMEVETCTLREQHAQVTRQMIIANKETASIKAEIEDLQQEKVEKIQFLDGCKKMCDDKKQSKVDELHALKVELEELKEKIIECRCKMPVDATVVAKRTPSLVALCRCSPGERLDSCSCTSLRTSLLTNLLSDLFGGLQTELPNTGADMPCQLLKCLEDKHNWDRSSEAKTNLRCYFSRLLLGELDIAIATSLENYHARWVGTTCADAKFSPRTDDDKDPGWEQRAIERRAQEMAEELAEHLFQQRAEQLAEQAENARKEPPCKCLPPRSQNQAAVFPVLINSKTPYDLPKSTNSSKKMSESTDSSTKEKESTDKSSPWIQTVLDVSQIKDQIEDLKKHVIKKEDLKLMENKIADILQQKSTIPIENIAGNEEKYNLCEEVPVKELQTIKHDQNLPNVNGIKSRLNKKKVGDNNKNNKKPFPQEKPTRHIMKPIHRQTYAVNLCLCNPRNTAQSSKVNDKGKVLIKQKQLKNILTPGQSFRQTKPINTNIPTVEMDIKQYCETSIPIPCKSDHNCFHKIPSNRSIDELLDKLGKCNYDLSDLPKRSLKYTKSILATIDYKNQVTDTFNYTTSTISQTDKIYAENKIDFGNNVNTEVNYFNKPDCTESVYVAAINLEKSTEDACNCKHIIEMRKAAKAHYRTKKSFIKPHVKSTQQKKFPKYDFTKESSAQESQTENINKPWFSNVQILTSDNISNKSLFKNLQEFNTNDNVIGKPYKNLTLPYCTELITDDVKIDKSRDISGSHINKRDYHIKFLGVTLEDINPQKLNEKHLTDNKYNKYQIPTKQSIEDCHSEMKQNVTILRSPKITSLSNEKSDNKKCECEAKLDEFKDFISSILNKETTKGNNMGTDKSIDLQSFNTSESCMCNKLNIDNSRELEVNAFHLLEDHLKGKLKEFKSCSCKSSCISPEEEERIFSIILKRVKQVISDCANKVKCSCVGNLSKDASWKRAYGLLQEYLKIKIKRVQCLCEFRDEKNVNMPHILEKVCKLIDNDFQRLKEICKCKNRDELEHLEPYFPRKNNILTTELPEKDNIFFNEKSLSGPAPNEATLKTLKGMSSMKSNYTLNMFTQIIPSIETKTKSCSAYSKYEQTTETDVIMTNNKSLGLLLVNTECNCDYDNLHPPIHVKSIHKCSCQTSPLTNAHVDNIAEYIEQNNDVSQTLSLQKLNVGNNLDPNIKELIGNTSNKVPYVGCTVTCSCEPNFGYCKCTKSVVQGNCDKIYNIWKGLALTTNDQSKDVSYIMNGVEKSRKLPTVLEKIDDNASDNSHITNNVMKSCDVETEVIDDEIVLLKSSTTEKLSTLHHTTNTYEESPSQETECSSSDDHLDWLEEIRPSVRASTIKLTNSIFFPEIKYDFNVNDTNDDLESSHNSEKCSCDKVPVCHVKMLVENIENNLLEFKCTCDSLVSKVCPVHSQQN